MATKISGEARASKRPESSSPPSRESLRQLLSFYYPIHYRIGLDLEKIMGQARISRKQTAILWLIHSRAGPDGWIRRKEIEERLSAWFEISNSSISNMLRDLTQPPLELAFQKENPVSGREKLVRLTESGETFVAGMIAESVVYLGKHLAHLDQDQMTGGLEFFKLAFGPLLPDAKR